MSPNNAAVSNSIRALDASGQQNFDARLAVLGRLEFDILDPYGYLETSPKLPSAPQLSAGIAVAYNPIAGTSTLQNVVRRDQTTNVTVDTGFRWQRLSFQAAGYCRHNNLKFLRGESNDWGYYGQLGYYLVPERWEIAGRISGVEFKKLNAPGVLGDTTAYSLGLNYYLYGHNVKLQSDYSFLDRDTFTGPNRRDHRVRVQTQILF